MLPFCEDGSEFLDFFGRQTGPSPDISIRHIDWEADNATCNPCTTPISGLTRQPEPVMRVIEGEGRFAPLDLRGERSLQPLFHHYNIPADFLTERLHSVAQSSNVRSYSDGSHSSWFHYLCKSIDVEPHPEFPGTSIKRIIDFHPDRMSLSQSNLTWLRTGFFLRWGGPLFQGGNNNKSNYNNGPVPPYHPYPPQPGMAASAATLQTRGVTLICFGAPHALEDRIQTLSAHPAWREAAENPYDLFVIVLDELFREMDEHAWNLGDAFQGIESKALQAAQRVSEVWITSTQQDFVGMHNVAKHAIYMIEAFDAIRLTIDDILEQHNELFEGRQAAVATRARLKHKLALVRSVHLRLVSLEKRTQNIINLSFNLVTQQDSRVLMSDSETMITITIMALVFLPTSTVAATFGSQFFSFDTSQTPPTFRVSSKFWIFWVVALAATAIVMGLWWGLRKRAIRKREKILRGEKDMPEVREMAVSR